MTFIKNTAENWYTTSSKSFVESLIPTNLDFTFEYESNTVGPIPKLSIWFNNNLIYTDLLRSKSKFSCRLEPGVGKQKILIQMYGKNESNTIVENNNIVNDTFVIFNNFQINNYRLLEDYNFFENYFVYKTYKTINQTKPLNGFWEDAVISLEFDMPFDLWYNRISKANKNLAEPMRLKTSANLESLIKQLEVSLKKLV